MIKTYKNKKLEKLLKENTARGIPSEQIKRIRRKLEVIHKASTVEDLNLPGYKLHELEGDRKGTWAIQITGNWRITFRFADGNAYNVNLEDYHRSAE